MKNKKNKKKIRKKKIENKHLGSLSEVFGSLWYSL